MTTAQKRRAKADTDDSQLEKTLEDTFPASDASSGNVIERQATRPKDRRPAAVDRSAVEKAAREVREKLGKG
jgi:hypothetical protein